MASISIRYIRYILCPKYTLFSTSSALKIMIKLSESKEVNQEVNTLRNFLNQGGNKKLLDFYDLLYARNQ